MSKEKILLVDDSPLVRKLAEVSLQEAGYEVYTADNGEDGLKIAENILPDLILVDFIMPKMTGSQFCNILKDNEKLKNIPILLITGKGETVGQTFIEKYGVVDYFIKPFKSEDLVDKVEKILREVNKLELKEQYIKDEEFDESYERVQFPEEVSFEKNLFDLDETIERTEKSSQELSDLMKESAFLTEEEIKIPDSFLIEQKQEEEKPLEESLNEKHKKDIDRIDIFQETSEKTLKESEEDILFYSEEIRDEVKVTKNKILSDDNIHIIKSQPGELYISEEIETIKKTKELEETKIEKIEELRDYIETRQKISSLSLDLNEIENLIDIKLKKFSEELIIKFKYYMEEILKKHGASKNINAILYGNLEGLGLKSLFELLGNEKISGIMTIFTKDYVFEIFLLEGYVVYCISDKNRSLLGDKLLRDIDKDELKQITLSSLSLLMDSNVEYFLLEKTVFNDDNFIYNFPKYKISDII